jgi:hypothetical protein
MEGRGILSDDRNGKSTTGTFEQCRLLDGLPVRTSFPLILVKLTEEVHEMLLLGRRTVERSMMRNLACITPKGFRNRLNIVMSNQSSLSGSGRPNLIHVSGFHILAPFKLRNFWRKEYEENMIRTTIRCPFCRACSLSVISASWITVNEGEEAQKHVENKTSVCA